MNWFDILKLGGEDLFDGEKLSNELYDDTEGSGKIANYFYNQKDRVTTRPHFEEQAKQKFSGLGQKVEGDLQIIYDRIKSKSLTGNKRLFGFTSPDRTHLITWRVIGGSDMYPSSGTNLTPKKLENEKPVLVFDSVYESDKWQKGGLDKNNFRELFDGDEEVWKELTQKGSKGRYGTANIFTMNRRKEPSAQMKKWNADMKKLKNSLNWEYNKKKRNWTTIKRIEAEITKLTRRKPKE